MPFCHLAQAIEKHAQISAKTKRGERRDGGHTFTLPGAWTGYCTATEKKKIEKRKGGGGGIPEWEMGKSCSKGKNKKIDGLKLTIKSIR